MKEVFLEEKFSLVLSESYLQKVTKIILHEEK